MVSWFFGMWFINWLLRLLTYLTVKLYFFLFFIVLLFAIGNCIVFYKIQVALLFIQYKNVHKNNKFKIIYNIFD